jgi:hypothetical protein
VDLQHIPMDNLESLQKYMAHKHWPSSAAVSVYAPAVALLHMWVTHTIKFATLFASEGGAPPPMTTKNGLFDSVLLCQDGCEDGYGE